MKKYALVTGASRGIGRAIAKAIAADHQYNIIVNYAGNHQAANQVKQEIEALGVEVELLPFDVADNKLVKSALDEWYQNHPEDVIEVLVNNAGITDDKLFVWMEESAWDRVLGVSLKGFYNLTQYLCGKMIHKRFGRIVNVVSLSGLKGVPGQTNYSAAKAGVIGATKALAQEIAKRKITVNAVAPGFIQSDMTAGLDEEMLKKMVPMNRFGNVEEVADVVSFLVSPKASYITGEVININGGLYS